MKIKLEKNNKKVTFKNYFTVIIVVILTVVLALYIRTFIVNYRENISSVSIFSNNIQSIHINDLDFAIPETGEGIIYISYTGNVKISNMENKLYEIIESKGLKEITMYLDITDYLDDNKYLEILKNKFPNIAEEINTAPLFIYIKDGAAVEAMSSELKMADYKVYNKILEKYEIE